MLDVLISGGDVVDGTRRPRFRADVAVRGDRIVGIGALADASARQRIDAAGCVVAPGFIDVHNHSDGWFLQSRCLEAKVTQGFTSEVLMADGISYAPVGPETVHPWFFYLRGLDGLRVEQYRGWETLSDYMQLMHGRNVQNAATHLPYANVRALVAGFQQATLDDYQLRQIRYEVRQNLEQGAVGVSTGLDYIVQCLATTEELVAVCREMAPFQGLYATHVRYKLGLVPAVREALEIGRRAGVRVHISHLKSSSPQLAEEVLGCLDQAGPEVDVSFDVYPYSPGSTLLSYLLPYSLWKNGPLAAMAELASPALRSQLRAGLSAAGLDLRNIHIAWLPGRDNQSLIGQSLHDYAASLGRPIADAICNLLIEERLAVLCVLDDGQPEFLAPFLTHPCGMIATDGIFFPDSRVHPRVYGTVGRLLGTWVRDKSLLSLEEAVYKLSGFPAARFGLAQRGRVAEKCFADLVVFDPTSIADRATFESPHQTCVGVQHVLVNGKVILSEGQLAPQDSEPQPGRFLRRGQE